MNDIDKQQELEQELPESDLKLLRILKKALTEEVDAVALTYSEEGHPPLHRFAEAGASGAWEWHEKDHFRKPCHSCQRTLAMQWDRACPDDSILRNSVTAPFHFSEALQIHLGACGECRGRLRLLKAGTAFDAIGIGGLRLVGRHNDIRQHFDWEGAFADGDLIVTLRENYQGQLQARIKSPDPSNAGRRVRFALRLANGEVKAPPEPLVLLPAGKHGSLNEYPIGPFKDLAEHMSKFEVQVEWEE